MDQTITAPVAQDATQSDRKPYGTPTLIDFGSFAEITQGDNNTGSDIGIYS